MPQGLHDLEPGRGPRWQDATQHADHDGEAEPLGDAARLDVRKQPRAAVLLQLLALDPRLSEALVGRDELAGIDGDLVLFRPRPFDRFVELARAQDRFALSLMATFALLATLSYALVESNLGTAYRHRAQVLVLYLVFAAVGIATRGERQKHEAPDPNLVGAAA